MNTNQRAYCQNDYFFLSSFFLSRFKKILPNISGILTFIELDGVRYFYYIDATHTVRGLFNSDGELLVRYSYDAWGNVTNIIDYSSISLSTLNPFLFKCYYYDHESKWYYCLSRYYVPLWMRWLSIDDSSYLTSELPAGYNLYVYCNNNPIMCEDPSGEASFWSQIGDWFQDHWVELVVGTAFIVAGALVTAATAGTGLGFMAAFGSALLASASQVGISIAVGIGVNGFINLVNGETFFNDFGDTVASSYMWGGIFAGGAQILSGVSIKAAQCGFKGFGRFLSPDRLRTTSEIAKIAAKGQAFYNSGGRLLSFKLVALDVGTKSFLHLHLWFTTTHICLGAIVAGVIGGL